MSVVVNADLERASLITFTVFTVRILIVLSLIKDTNSWISRSIFLEFSFNRSLKLSRLLISTYNVDLALVVSSLLSLSAKISARLLGSAVTVVQIVVFIAFLTICAALLLLLKARVIPDFLALKPQSVFFVIFRILTFFIKMTRQSIICILAILTVRSLLRADYMLM
ncbi:hypothetical protein GVAMD_0819 [Gardnerella vaginalis AMD]|nr:hypothetical protein GVAMD_0819 [Gardnerella vaginalis AMD]